MLTRPQWQPNPDIQIPAAWEGAYDWYSLQLHTALKRGGAKGYDLVMRHYAEHDLWFLLVFVLNSAFVGRHPWVFARCREVQADPNGYIDLWSREHFKSTIITIGMTFLEIIRDPDVTIGIFSHTRPIAKAFLRQIKMEMEMNERLPRLWPHIFWVSPTRESPKWSEDEGIVVRRPGNPKEATIEAWGLVDGQPTSKHFKGRVYDDVVTKESVATAEQIKKTTEAYELSDNLGSRGGWVRIVGTRYHLYDTYETLMERGVAIPRIHPATHNGKEDGKPVLFTPAEWAIKKKTQRSTMAAQLLLAPLAAGAATFDPTTLRGYQLRPQFLNVYIMGDPSKGPQAKSKDSDNTAIAVIGVSSSGARYLLDGYCHRMKLSDRWLALRNMFVKWSAEPGVLSVDVGYEQYGMQSDIEYFEERQTRDKAAQFPIRELAWPREGLGSKVERIGRIEPYFNNSQFFIPILIHTSHVQQQPPEGRKWKYGTWFVDEEAEKIGFRGLLNDTRTIIQSTTEGRAHLIIKPIVRRDDEGIQYDFTVRFIQEFTTHPAGRHDDLLDCVSRIEDMQTVPAMIQAQLQHQAGTYRD